MKRILFVCTGNTCRSPMAEGMLRQMADKAGLDLEVRSAGVAAAPGIPMSAHAKTALQKRGIQKNIVSNTLDDGLLDWADLILTMTTAHKRHVMHYAPTAVDKTYTLKEYIKRNAPQSSNIDAEAVERRLAELELKLALEESLTDEEQEFWTEWSHWRPDDDVLDPFGGSESQYEATAHEIEDQLHLLVQLLSNN